jgi:hypothetical protein
MVLEQHLRRVVHLAVPDIRLMYLAGFLVSKQRRSGGDGRARRFARAAPRYFCAHVKENMT